MLRSTSMTKYTCIINQIETTCNITCIMVMDTHDEENHHLRHEDCFFFPERPGGTSGDGTKQY